MDILKKLILAVLLIPTVTTYSQITVNIGNDVVVHKNDTITLTANVTDNSNTLIDSIIAAKIPLVVLDTTLIMQDDNGFRDVIYIRDWVHNYYPSPYVILVKSSELNVDLREVLQSDILNSGNYNRHVIYMMHPEHSGIGQYKGYTFDYKVNDNYTQTIPAGRYLLFLTNHGDGWGVIKNIEIGGNYTYEWNTGDNTKSIQLIVKEVTPIEVKVKKLSNIYNDNLIIYIK